MTRFCFFLPAIRCTSTWGRSRKCILKARWGNKKPLGGVVQGTLGIHKIIILNIPPGAGGQDNGFYVKNGGKIDIFSINLNNSENDSMVCCEKRS